MKRAQFDVAGVPIKHLSAERKRQLGARTLKPIEAERMIEMISPVIVEIIRAMDEKQYRRLENDHEKKTNPAPEIEAAAHVGRARP